VSEVFQHLIKMLFDASVQLPFPDWIVHAIITAVGIGVVYGTIRADIKNIKRTFAKFDKKVDDRFDTVDKRIGCVHDSVSDLERDVAVLNDRSGRVKKT